MPRAPVIWRLPVADVLADRLEQLPDKPLRRPVRQADLAAPFADADQFGGGPVLIGGEHDAEGRDHDIEALVGKRQRFGVGLVKRHAKPFRIGAPTGAIQKRRHVICRYNVAPPPCCRQAGIAVARRNVEDLLSGSHVESLAKRFTDDLQGRSDHRIIPDDQAPCWRALSALRSGGSGIRIGAGAAVDRVDRVMTVLQHWVDLISSSFGRRSDPS